MALIQSHLVSAKHPEGEKKSGVGDARHSLAFCALEKASYSPTLTLAIALRQPYRVSYQDLVS